MMEILLSILLVVVVLSIVIFFIKITLKTIFMILVVIGIIFTIWVCFDKPILHKPFAINTIEYLLKINKDGSLTTTKTTTQSQYREIHE